MKKIFVLLLTGFFHNGHSQTGDLRADTDAIFNDLNRFRSTTAKQSIEGSSYYYDEYQNGEIYFKNGTNYRGVKLNIDLTTQEIIYLFKAMNGIVSIEYIREVRVQIPEDSLKYQIFKTSHDVLGTNQPNAFYLMLYQGRRVSLVQNTRVVVKESDGFGRKAEFFKVNDVFLATEKGLIKVKGNKNQCLNLLPEKRMEIDHYIKTHKLNQRKLNDLITLVTYCDSLYAK